MTGLPSAPHLPPGHSPNDLPAWEGSPEQPGLRLDRWLANRRPDLSRARIQTLIASGHITVNGHSSKPSYPLRLGDAVRLILPPPIPADCLPEQIPLAILYEDDHLLVINKPPGLVVHPAPGHSTGTLVNALLHHCAHSLSGIGGVSRPGILHRLDKDTSGLLIVAKSDAAHHAISEQFLARTIQKTYLALTRGLPKHNSGIIQGAIGRHPSHRQRMAILPTGGRAATTRYQVRQRFPHGGLIECDLLTGRTHQIRVHLRSLNCPVLGDSLYGKPDLAIAPRQMLHAWRIQFHHPTTGGLLACEAPIPSDFLAAQAALEAGR